MEIRKIKAEKIKEEVKRLFTDCNYYIGSDIISALENAALNEKSPAAVSALNQIIKNDKIAAEEKIPICQDTGMAVLFVEYGDKVVIEDGSFEDAVNEGVREAYRDGYLRKSIVSDPVFDRKNTNDNTPCVIHVKIVPGTEIKITAGGKGFGSENMSSVKMLPPSVGEEGIIGFVLETVEHAGPNPCPPIIVGIGIGGTFDMAAVLAKKATFRRIDEKNTDPRYAEMEKYLLEKINKMGFGAAGLGGKYTALGVNIEAMPTHIAGMPVAVNICCHAARHCSAVI